MDDLRIQYVDHLGDLPPYDMEDADPNYNDPNHDEAHVDRDLIQSLNTSKGDFSVTPCEGVLAQEPAGCIEAATARLRERTFSPSIPCFSITLSVVPVIITAVAILLAMSNLYSKAIDEFAENSASSLSTTTATNVVAQLQAPSDVIDELQYTSRMQDIQMPTIQEAEKLRVLQGLEELVAAQNISSDLLAPTTALITSQYDQATEMIKTSFLSAMRQSGDKCPTLMLAWKDGSFMSSSCPANKNTYSFVKMLPNTTSPLTSPMTTYTFEVDRATGQNITEIRESSAAFSSKNSDWYYSARTPMAKTWSALSIVRRPIRPVVLLTGALYDKANTFLGVAGYFFSIEQLTNMLQNTPRQSGSEIFILSGSGRVVGSSSGKLCYTSEEYHLSPGNNDLSETDIVVNMCSYASEIHTKYCLHSVDSYGNKDLIDVRDKLPKDLIFATSVDQMGQVARTSFLDGSKPRLAKITNYKGHATYVSWIPLAFPGSPTLDWTLIVILPADRVTEVRLESLKWSVIIAVILILAITITVVIFARRVLRPLGTIVKLMTFSAYLHDATVEESSEGDSERRSSPKLTEKMKLQLADRTLSRWVEVRGIQKAYWSLSEELQALKAYIPEHLRDEVIAMHKTSKPKPAATPVKGITTKQIEAIQLLGGDACDIQEKSFSDLKCDLFSDGGGSGSKDQGRTSSGTGTDSGRDSILNGTNTDGAASVAFTHDSFEDASVAAAKAAVPVNSHEHPIFFADNVLVDRDITVVHINIVHFHYYARSHPGVTITRDYEEYISFLHREARRHGGILESFSGDKVWVSFNASSKCVNGPIAAAYFAYHVTSYINNAVIAKARDAVPMPHQASSQEPVSTNAYSSAHYLQVAPYGITCGVATGRAFVGPLGNTAIKRHTIISNAMSEAVALERQALRYPGCNVMVGGDMIPAIEGYCQYVLVDTTLLPGSDGKRRRIACLKGPMVDPKCDMEQVRRWLPPAEVVSTCNRFKTINEAMNAFLEGQYEVCRTLLGAALGEFADLPIDAPIQQRERKATVEIMSDLLGSFLDTQVDGRVYKSPLGDHHTPAIHALTLF